MAIVPDRHSCLKCGFLSGLGSSEVSEHDRALIAAKGKAGWFEPNAPFDCAKHLWWYDEAAVEVILFEANRPRPQCPGFGRWIRGRTPEEHRRLEDESRTFQHQSRLAWRSFWGGLIGALIGAGILNLLSRVFA